MSPATPTEDTIIAASPDTDSVGVTNDPQAGGLFSTGNETILSGIDSSITGNALAAKASADAAKASEANAASSATSAATSATNASTSASNAATSATSAASDLASIGTSLTDAETARDAAQTAQAAAETAETNAETAETNAATSATNASTSASTATTKAGEANTSATAAGNSATSASTSATSASNSASTATTKASEASTSATNAATSASTATTKASEASTSATNAASSASTATTKASEASSSAASASTSASTATTKASEAATSETNAATSATAAQTAQTAAETAETNAETAETNASASASTATTKAGEASTSATNAANSATSASGSASTATTKAGEASSSATNAATSETNAASSATSASNSASTATTKASEASTSAGTATTKAGEANTSATNAATSETNAGTSETNAASSASAASTSETNAASSATSASGSASTATTKASEAATSASNASTSETNAASSATSASTSASNASSSATSAASAQTAAESARDATLAAYDNFDDRYLGVKSSDPSVDNDGNALIAGALYFNSTSESMQVYTGSAWVAAYVSGTGFAALSGATFTGDVTVPNLITSGNVDGRDVSADGTKLDGIASGATANTGTITGVTAGTGLSGGGTSGTVTLNFSGTIPTATSDLTNDSGFITSADAGNAQTLDSLDSTQFLRSDAADTKTSGNLTFSDDVQLRAGDGGDLRIYHDGSNSFIHGTTGNTQISQNGFGYVSIQGKTGVDGIRANSDESGGGGNVELFHIGSKKAETTSTGMTITGVLASDGISLGDSDSGNSFANRIKLGAGNDLQLFHSGTASFISDTGTGNLFITGSNAISFQSGDYGETYATFNDDGAVSLRHDNSVKFETTSTGASITGDLALTSTDAGATENPTLDLYRNSASPADNDVLGHITFTGENSAGEKIQYAEIEARNSDVTDGTEDGQLIFKTMIGGTDSLYLQMFSGFLAFYRTLLLKSVDIIFEGATDDAFETTLTVTDPTADRTITLPDASGTVLLTNGNGSSLTNVNATTLDSVDSTSFLRSDAADTKTSGNLTFNDDIELSLGTGDDLRLRHDGTDSYISNKTGNLYIGANDPSDVGGNVYIRAKIGESDTSIVLNDDSNINFYSNGSEKLAITSTNLISYANLIVRGSDNDIIFQPSAVSTNKTRLDFDTVNQDATLTVPNVNGAILTTGNSDAPTTTTSSGDADFVLVDDGGTMKKITPANLGITADGGNAATLDSLDSTQFLRSDAADTKTSGDLTFSDNVQLRLGASQDLSIYHDGTNSYVSNKTGNLFIGANDTTDVGGDVYIRAKIGENDTSIILNDDSGIIFYSNGSVTMQMYSSILYIYDNTTLQSSANLILNGGDVVFDTGTYNTTITSTTGTADRTITLPDASGTVALTSDLPTDLDYGLITGSVDSTADYGAIT